MSDAIDAKAREMIVRLTEHVQGAAVLTPNGFYYIIRTMSPYSPALNPESTHGHEQHPQNAPQGERVESPREAVEPAGVVLLPEPHGARASGEAEVEQGADVRLGVRVPAGERGSVDGKTSLHPSATLKESDENLSNFEAPISQVPCSTCGGKCREFVVPNDVWNAVVRREGREHGNEYLCEGCYRACVESFVRDLLADRDGWKREYEMYANAWSRELGYPRRVKTHPIDELVGGTRALRLQADVANNIIADRAEELRQRKLDADIASLNPQH